MPSHIKEAAAADPTGTPTEYEALKRDFAAMQADLKVLVQALSDKGGALAGEALDGMSDASKRAVDTAESTIRKRPLLAVLLAFVIGMLLGRVFVSRR